MAVHEPPLGLPFVDENFYVARPWIEWLVLARANFVSIEDDIDYALADDIAANAAAIVLIQADVATLQSNVTTIQADVTTLQADVLSNEALSFYFAGL